MRPRTILFVGLAVTAVALAAPSLAYHKGEKDFRASMSPFEEVPAVSSTATGTFVAKVVDGGGDAPAIEYEMSYDAFEGSITQSHLHVGQAAANGGISVWLCSNLASPPTPPGVQPCPPGPATITGTITASDVVGPAAQGLAGGEILELLAAMRAGVVYANVHSTKFPGGELRGQLI